MVSTCKTGCLQSQGQRLRNRCFCIRLIKNLIHRIRSTTSGHLWTSFHHLAHCLVFLLTGHLPRARASSATSANHSAPAAPHRLRIGSRKPSQHHFQSPLVQAIDSPSPPIPQHSYRPLGTRDHVPLDCARPFHAPLSPPLTKTVNFWNWGESPSAPSHPSAQAAYEEAWKGAAESHSVFTTVMAAVPQSAAFHIIFIAFRS